MMIFLALGYSIFFVAAPVCIVEQVGIRVSLSRSRVLSKDHRLQIFGALILIVVADVTVGMMTSTMVRRIGVDAGLIAVDTPWNLSLSVPVVTVSGHNNVKGVTNIVLNHQRAAELALKHLFQLGHRKIAFIKGQAFSSDTEVRWANIEKAARHLGIQISGKLVVQLEENSPSPHVGLVATKKTGARLYRTIRLVVYRLN